MTTKPTWWPSRTETKEDKVVLEAKEEMLRQEIKTVKRGLKKQTIVMMFMSNKFRWTANKMCPVWLVPEHREGC